jgi:hypothetical protein
VERDGDKRGHQQPVSVTQGHTMSAPVAVWKRCWSSSSTSNLQTSRTPLDTRVGSPGKPADPNRQ